jgi:hypothetical protein
MTGTGHLVAKLALEKLLQRAERAWSQQAERTCALVFSDASFPDYFKLPLRVEKDAVHAELRNAERDGAIKLEWDRRAGADGQILRALLIDAEQIATILGRSPAWRLYEEAYRALQPWSVVPSVQEILARWRVGKQVRGLGSNRVADFVDACKVVDACVQFSGNEDIPVRRLSATLFSDSKRIESIAQALDAMTIDSLDAPGRDIEDVLSGLGLVKLPQPVLLAGNGSVKLSDGRVIPIPLPYIGLAPQSIKGVSFDNTDGYLLTVENLTIFHELALGKAGPPRGIILYTAGMPSPALLRVYRLCLSPTANRKRFHWGDIDLGGFRIAASFARANNSPLVLWSMDPTDFPDTTARKNLSTEERKEVIRIGERWGWDEVAHHVFNDGRAIEQEAIPLRLPEW